MLQLLHYALILVGLTYIVTQSAVGRPLRMFVSRAGSFLESLIYCPACTGFWLGAALVSLWPFPTLVFAPLESAVGACGLMALYKEWGPQVDVWSLEQGRRHDRSLEKKDGR